MASKELHVKAEIFRPKNRLNSTDDLQRVWLKYQFGMSSLICHEICRDLIGQHSQYEYVFPILLVAVGYI